MKAFPPDMVSQLKRYFFIIIIHTLEEMNNCISKFEKIKKVFFCKTDYALLKK